MDVVWCVFDVIGVDVGCRVCDVFGIYVVWYAFGDFVVYVLV